MFVLWSIGFWILISVVSIAVLIAVEVENVGIATAALIAAFCMLAWWGDFNLVREVVAHPSLLAMIVAGYFVAGTVWSIIKWWFFVKDKLYRYNEAKREFLRTNGFKDTSQVPDQLLKRWRYYAHDGRHDDWSAKTPQVRQNKGRILTWMIYWPWSMAWTVINDPIKKLFKRIYRAVSGMLQRIADITCKDVKDDLRPTPVEPEKDATSDKRPYIPAPEEVRWDDDKLVRIPPDGRLDDE